MRCPGIAFFVGLLAANLAACGPSSSSGQPGAPTSPPRNGLVISGLEDYAPFLLLGETVQLRATRYVDGNATDCTASADWSTSDIYTVKVETLVQKGRIRADRWGAADISASCAGATTVVRVKVGKYRVHGTVRDLSGRPIANVDVTVNHDSPFWATDSQGRFDAGEVATPSGDLALTRPGYEQLNRRFDWQRQAELSLNLVMSQPGRLILEGRGVACEAWSDCWQEHRFKVGTPGTLRLDTFATPCYDYCSVVTEWYCGDRLIASGQKVEGWRPLTLTVQAEPSCNYRVRYAAIPFDRIPYRFGVTISP